MNVHSKIRQREAQLLGAALRLFAERGFHGTAVPEIAKAAGVATGSLYRIFPSKEHLANALYRTWKSELASRLAEDVPLGAPPRQLFHHFWTRLAGFAREVPLAFVFLELHHHQPYLDRKNRQLEEATLRPIAMALEAAMAAGAVRKMTPAALIAMVWGAMLGLVKGSLLGYLDLNDVVLDETEEALWTAIAPVKAKR
jgi:AcrR family transcriptional regulator